MDYHVKDNSDFYHKKLNFFVIQPSFHHCNFVVHAKSYVSRGLINHHDIKFNTKLVHVICTILQIPCACYECKYMLDKPWVSGSPPQQQMRYQKVHDYTYWQLLGCFNNWNIIKLSHKSTTSGYF